jgi:signal transduction histidine kinase
VTLNLARESAVPGSHTAELLDAAAAELAAGLAELRELARGIHPAVLTERGLDPSLESLAARAPLPVSVSASLDGRLPPAVEAAAYFVVMEALTNVAKYSRASAAQVTVAHQNGHVTVDVHDDGGGERTRRPAAGWPASRTASPRSAGASWWSPPGGETVVRAELPARRSESATAPR